MSYTYKLQLPHIITGQAQKEVTHNEAIDLLDVFITPVVINIIHEPIDTPIKGSCFLISASPKGIFSQYAHHIAKAVEGGWHYIKPFKWMDLWVEKDQDRLIWNGNSWIPFGLLIKSNGESLTARHKEETISLNGNYTKTAITLPNRSLVIAVNCRVVENIEGVPAFHIGVANDITRYGNSLDVKKDTTNIGMSYHPITYYADTPLIITAKKDHFSSGKIHITTQYFQPHGPWNW